MCEITKKLETCHICGKTLNILGDILSYDYGGACLECMAYAGDHDAIIELVAIAKTHSENLQLYYKKRFPNHY